MRADETQPIRLAARLMVILALAVIGGLGVGLVLDTVLGSRPLATLCLSLVGILVGSAAVYRVVAAAFARLAQVESPPPSTTPRQEGE
jgi:F0F1-type ATP synthase assembly protein I